MEEAGTTVMAIWLADQSVRRCAAPWRRASLIGDSLLPSGESSRGLACRIQHSIASI